IRDPRDHRRMLWSIEIADAALATSGRSFDLLSGADHPPSAIIDPGRQGPAAEIAGASVQASSCLVADALTKIVMIRSEGAMPLLRHYGASALLVTSARAAGT